MSDLIRRSDLAKILKVNEPMNWHDTDEEITEKACWHWFNKVVEEAPAVDAVEVVRCKDCKFSKPADNNDYIVCEIMECYCGLMKDDFCVCGKRREENAVD